MTYRDVLNGRWSLPDDEVQALQPPVRAAVLIRLHSRYKYALMAYSPALYKTTGRLLAQAGTLSPAALCDTAETWTQALVSAFSQPATRANMTNALMHMQGYFKRVLTTEEKQQLTAAILAYRQGTDTPEAVKAMILHYAQIHDIRYLCDQALLQPVAADAPGQSHSGLSRV